MFTFKQEINLRDYHQMVGFDYVGNHVWKNLTDDEIDYLDDLMQDDEWDEGDVDDFIDNSAEEELVTAYIMGYLKMPFHIIDELFKERDSIAEIASEWVHNCDDRQWTIRNSNDLGTIEERFDQLMVEYNEQLGLLCTDDIQHGHECFLVQNTEEYLNEVNYRVLWNADREDLLI